MYEILRIKGVYQQHSEYIRLLIGKWNVENILLCLKFLVCLPCKCRRYVSGCVSSRMYFLRTIPHQQICLKLSAYGATFVEWSVAITDGTVAPMSSWWGTLNTVRPRWLSGGTRSQGDRGSGLWLCNGIPKPRANWNQKEAVTIRSNSSNSSNNNHS